MATMNLGGFLMIGKRTLFKKKTFDNLTDAETYYVEVWQKLSQNYTYVNTKPNYLTAFWNDGEERWCEECDEDLQQYFGLALLENHHAVTFENKAEFTTISNHFGKTKFCKRKVI